MTICKDCRSFDRAETDLDENHRCLHEKAEYRIGGITTPEEVRHYTCHSMLAGVCGGHKLWEAKDTNV